MAIELDYSSDDELHVVVCRTPRDKLYVHILDESGEVHGEPTVRVDGDESTYIPDDKIVEVDA